MRADGLILPLLSHATTFPTRFDSLAHQNITNHLRLGTFCHCTRQTIPSLNHESTNVVI